MGMMHPGFNQTVFNAATMGRGFAFVPPSTMRSMMAPAASPPAGGTGATPAAYQTNANPYLPMGNYSRSPYLETYDNSSRNYSYPGTYSQRQTAQMETSHVLDTLGVPTKDGKVTWPLGLRILPPDEETKTLRLQIDALVQRAAERAAEGRPDSRALEEVRRAVDELRGLLHKKKDAFPAPYTYTEADRFLTRLVDGLKTLQ
jgi:hypothetical protein